MTTLTILLRFLFLLLPHFLLPRFTLAAAAASKHNSWLLEKLKRIPTSNDVDRRQQPPRRNPLPIPPPPPPPPISHLEQEWKNEDSMKEENDKEENDKERKEKEWSLPPPPPLPSREYLNSNYPNGNPIPYNLQQQQQQQQQFYYSEDTNEFNDGRNRNYSPSNMDYPKDSTMYRNPPPPYYNQYYDDPSSMMDGNYYNSVHNDNVDDDSMMTTLSVQLANVTSDLEACRALADERLHQIDVLREQLADAESFAASESNAALEAKSNATALYEQNLKIKHMLEDWKGRCEGLQSALKNVTLEKEDACEALDEKKDELEALASAIEAARLQDNARQLLALDDRGFFQRLFDGIFVLKQSKGSGSDRVKAAQELSRNTLMDALKAERNHVEELEQQIMRLRQNNTAISDMVLSRDDLVNELNDRVQVFEEDKIVLKAALKQLQQEMREEMPKTAKLHFDLNTAKTEIEVLNEEIAQMKEDHDQELLSLQAQLNRKDEELQQAEDKMNTIGSYVDQLEQRLTSFKLAQMQHLEDEKQRLTDHEREELERLREQSQVQIDALQEQLRELQDRASELEQNKLSLTAERDNLLNQLEVAIESRDAAYANANTSPEKEFCIEQPKGLMEYDEYDHEENDGIDQDGYDSSDTEVEDELQEDPSDDTLKDNRTMDISSSSSFSSVTLNDLSISQPEESSSITTVEEDINNEPKLPELPSYNQLSTPGTQPQHSTTLNAKRPRVPFRGIRKTFAKMTGAHHFFSSSINTSSTLSSPRRPANK